MLETGYISFDQFTQREFDRPVEWVDGRVVEMTPVQKPHARLCAFLMMAVRAYVGTRELGEVLGEPFVMKTGENLPGRSPDLLFVHSDNLERLKTGFLDGPADLVIEVLSPESRGRDRGEKFFEYEEGGVRDYWLLDPYRQHAEFYLLEDARYEPIKPDSDGTFRSRVIEGLDFQVEEFWGSPFPPLVTLLRRWKII